MLRRGEDKAAMKPTEYISPYTDRPIRREDLEDPEHVGHMRAELFPCPPDIWNAAVHYRLRSPSGKQTWPVEVKPDPGQPRVEEAPEDLGRGLGEAEEAQAAWQRRRQELFEAGRRATERWQLAARQQNAKAYDSALAEELRVAEQLRDLETELPTIQIRLGKAHDAIRHWQYVERLRRTEAAAR